MWLILYFCTFEMLSKANFAPPPPKTHCQFSARPLIFPADVNGPVLERVTGHGGFPVQRIMYQRQMIMDPFCPRIPRLPSNPSERETVTLCRFNIGQVDGGPMLNRHRVNVCRSDWSSTGVDFNYLPSWSQCLSRLSHVTRDISGRWRG